LFDTKVLMDVLLDRRPFAEESALVMDQVARSWITGLICASTVITVFYLASKEAGNKEALVQIRRLLGLFEVAPVTRSVLEEALNNKAPDFEDAVLAEAAHQAGATAIITRNLNDFTHSPVRAYTPRQWLSLDSPTSLDLSFSDESLYVIRANTRSKMPSGVSLESVTAAVDQAHHAARRQEY
jgi:predicted nucleic acid-binding protein